MTGESLQKPLEKTLINHEYEVVTTRGVREKMIDWENSSSGYDYDAIIADYRAPEIMFSLVKEELTAREQKGITVFDFGCGTGKSGAYFISEGHEVYGIDFQKGWLQLALKRGYSGVVNADLANVGLKKSADLALSTGVAGDYINEALLFEQMISSIKKDGLIAMTTDTRFREKDKITSILLREKFDFFQKRFEAYQYPGGNPIHYNFLIASGVELKAKKTLTKKMI